ncbi:MAG: hypothetical protein IKE15_02310 [Clostridia bacterium]|nr:hypothetical protein [Clostridia bacterium]
MKISAAFKDAFRTYGKHFGATLAFLLVEACMTLAVFTPLLFLTNNGLKWLVLLVIPFYLLLMPWARVNAAAAMRDALGEGRLLSYRLIEPDNYRKKFLYGMKRCLMLLFWAAPMIAAIAFVLSYYYGTTDVLTQLRAVKSLGGGELLTGFLRMGLIFLATLLLLAFGCAFHSGDRHAFVRGNPKLLRGHHGKLVLCWLCSQITVLPAIIAVIAVVILFIPVLGDQNAIMSKEGLPSMKLVLGILAAGAALPLPLLPLRSLIIAAFVNGLEKE